MAIPSTSELNVLFKKSQGVGSTNDIRQFFEEPFLGAPSVLNSQIWSQSALIPTTAPGGTNGQITGVVKRVIALSLTAVPGTTNSFQDNGLKDCIPFNYGDGSYNYVLTDSTGTSIAFGQGDWLVDTAAGLVTFYTTVPSNMPPKISFYQYVGNKGAAGSANESTDSTSTGSNVTLGSVSGISILRLTNASLSSVTMIPAGTAAQKLVLTNRTGASITLKNLNGATAANQILTGTSADLIMLKDTALELEYDSVTAKWQIVGGTGSGSGGTGKNYFAINSANPYFTTGQITPWSTFTTTLNSSGIPTSISAGATNLTFSAQNTNPLTASQSLYNGQIVKAAANAVGQGIISGAMTIDREDWAKVLYFQMAYELISGSMDISGTSTQSLQLFVYDVNNAFWYQPSGFRGINQFSGPGILKNCSFQTNPGPSPGVYQIALVHCQTDTTAYTLNTNDYNLGPAYTFMSAPMTDWFNYGPVVFGGTTTAPTKGTSASTVDEFWGRRVGGDFQFRWSYGHSTAGTATSGTGDYLVVMPTAIPPIDVSRVTAYSTVQGAATQDKSLSDVGNGTFSSTGNGVGFRAKVFVHDANNLRMAGPGGIFGGNSALTSTFGATSCPMSGVTFNASMSGAVPILGWSSNVQSSSDTDSRVVSGRATNATATVTSTYSDVTWTNVVSDKTGSFNATSSASTIKIPISGTYKFTGQLNVSAATITAGQLVTVGLFNITTSTTIAETTYVYQGTSVVAQSIPFDFEGIDCVGGQQFKIQIKSSATTPAITTSATINYFSFERTAGPNIILSTESINARYNGATATLTTSLSTILYSNKDYDSHGQYSTSTGNYTILVSGVYECYGSLFVNGGFSLGSNIIIVIQKNGTTVKSNTMTDGGGTSVFRASVLDRVKCVAGDVLRIQVSTTATTPTVAVSTVENTFFVARSGN